MIDSSGDRVVEYSSQGTDTVYSYVYSYTLTSHVENLYMYGSGYRGNGNSSRNYILGNSANNYIDGKSGNDTLNGGNGNDTVIGGAGNDTLTGGSGRDTFVIDDSQFMTPGVATIGDFQRGQDRLRVYGGRNDYSISYSGGDSLIKSWREAGSVIAVVENTRISSSDFQFLGSSSSNPGLPNPGPTPNPPIEPF